MPNDHPDQKDISITDFDMFLPESLEKLAELKLPFRIYSAVLDNNAEVDASEVSIYLDAMMDAAVWGAQNSEWVLAIKQRQDVREDFEDDYDLGPMQ